MIVITHRPIEEPPDMSKWKQIAKTRKMKELRSPQVRLARMTELKRQLKYYKDILPGEKKKLSEWERGARWARATFAGMLEEIARYEKELAELTDYDNKQKGNDHE
jgi:hypothetical protein